MTTAQTAVNAAATRWLAEHLEQPIGDPTAAAERIVKELLAMGLKPVQRPVPLRPAAVASGKTIAEAKAVVAEAVRAAKVSGGRLNSNPTVGLWSKRNTSSGYFEALKRSGDVLKGVKREN